MGELVGEVSVCGYACVCGVGVVRACVDVRVSVCVRLGLHAIQHATYAVLPKEGVVCVCVYLCECVCMCTYKSTYAGHQLQVLQERRGTAPL